MEKEQIYQIMADEIAERFNIEKSKITPELDFLKDVDADSIDFVELVLEVEDRFDVEIPDEEAAKLITLQQTVDYIYDYQQSH